MKTTKSCVRSSREKTTAASIKKFYKSMAAHGYVSKMEYEDLSDIIRDNMEFWQEDCAEFNKY